MVVQVSLKDQLKYGIKRTCRSCGVGFYDLDQHPSECPNCGALYELHVTARSRRSTDVEFDIDETLEKMPFDIEDTDDIKETSGGEFIEDDPLDL
ncbi:MAG: FYDLN acid domain-containing protein [Alphaproteobacteria bacterium]|nr:MAG: FYDLN acid domain-containing protein [Alphaproteobacteria bacterium]